MEIQGNIFYLNDEEIDHINEIRAKHTVIDNFLSEAFQYIETLGVKVEMYEIPDSFRTDGEFGAGWYGVWNGKYTNLISNRELYSGKPIFDGSWMWRKKSPNGNTERLECVMVGNSGSGGGGSSFSYDNGFIAIDTLPLLKKRMFVELEITKATQELNEELMIIEDTFHSNTKHTVTAKKKESAEYNLVSGKIHQVIVLLSDLRSKKSQMEQQFEVESVIENSVDLPVIEDSLLDLEYYHKLKKRLNEYDKSDLRVIDLSDTANKIYQVVEEFPDKFI